MINKLKQKFIFLSMIVTISLMTVLVGTMNILNYRSTLKDIDDILDVLATKANKQGNFLFTIPFGMSPEIPYESRYFSITILPNGLVIDKDLSNISSISKYDLEQYTLQAFSSYKQRDFINEFRYLKSQHLGATKIVFFDCGRKLVTYNHFLKTSVIIGVVGCLIAFCIFIYASKIIVKPLEIADEKQKRFITDAGHELKTPLTIINANVDILESDIGDNESLNDIRQQSKYLTKLINKLVHLSKINEENKQKITFSLSDIITDTCESFNGLAQNKSIDYQFNITKDLPFYGLPDDISELANILLDNAFKYVSPNGKIIVELNTDKKNNHLIVKNTIAETIEKQEINKIFERFYRLDSSHNSKTGGQGIGLAIARSLVEKYQGNIKADIVDGFFTITVTSPK